MVPWWALLIVLVLPEVLKWTGRLILFKSSSLLFRNVKNELIGGLKNGSTESKV